MKQTKLSGMLWFNIIFFGLIGQIAWVVENMYFATFCQDIFSNSNRSDLSYIVTTLMVIFSAMTATAATIWAGAKCDRVGKRRPFISLGYILWGFTIMIFALIPMKAEPEMLFATGAMLVIFDCVMTFAGSSSNDAAFNAWVADNTDTTNRGRVNSVLSMLPVFSVIIVFIGLGSFYSSQNSDNGLFFILLGSIPVLAGIAALFILKDADGISSKTNKEYIKDTFYGFRREAIHGNKMMYICLSAICIIGISQQTFFSYLMNFVIRTLGYGDRFVVPVAVIILGAAAMAGGLGFYFDRYGRKRFYFPLAAMLVFGTFSFYLLRSLSGGFRSAAMYLGGIIMMGSALSLTASLQAAFQDYIPAGFEGRFQGVRMCFMVLIPMVIGPIISMLIGLDAMGMNGEDFAPTYEIFLAAAIIAFFSFIPLFYVRADADRLRSDLIVKIGK